MRFQPFELDPAMPPGGQEITEHLTQKYGRTPEQQSAVRDAIRERGAAVGVEFRKEGRDRIYNTFNAHRLLHWAGVHRDRQHALKKALLKAYFSDGRSPTTAVLLDAVTRQAWMRPAPLKSWTGTNTPAKCVSAKSSSWTMEFTPYQRSSSTIGI